MSEGSNGNNGGEQPPRIEKSAEISVKIEKVKRLIEELVEMKNHFSNIIQAIPEISPDRDNHLKLFTFLSNLCDKMLKLLNWRHIELTQGLQENRQHTLYYLNDIGNFEQWLKELQEIYREDQSFLRKPHNIRFNLDIIEPIKFLDYLNKGLNEIKSQI